MSLTIKISGIYLSPQAMPLPGIQLNFETLYNSSQTQLQTIVGTTTDSDAAYSIDLVPNSYSVWETYNKDGRAWKKHLGNIQIFPDSVPGTLNEYLTSFKADQEQPGILAEMEEILAETKAAASTAGIVPRGAYVSGTTYAANDLVEVDGSEYRATAEITGVAPPAAPWEIFVSAGGPGPAGPANVLTIGTVTTLAPGEMATAELDGESPDQVLNLGIPQGEKGDSGSGGGDPVVSPDWDGPGEIIFGYYNVGEDESYHAPGETCEASKIYSGDITYEIKASSETSQPSWVTHPRGGTWRLQGSTDRRDTIPDVTEMKCVLIFRRIDGTTAMDTARLLRSASERNLVRNCRYAVADQSLIQCEVLVNEKWYPFAAGRDDCTVYGPIIYRNAVDGMYGIVEEYQGGDGQPPELVT